MAQDAIRIDPEEPQTFEECFGRMGEIERAAVRMPCRYGREQNLQRLRAETLDLAGIDDNIGAAMGEQAFGERHGGLEVQDLIENDGLHFVFVPLRHRTPPFTRLRLKV